MHHRYVCEEDTVLYDLSVMFSVPGIDRKFILTKFIKSKIIEYRLLLKYTHFSYKMCTLHNIAKVKRIVHKCSHVCLDGHGENFPLNILLTFFWKQISQGQNWMFENSDNI